MNSDTPEDGLDEFTEDLLDRIEAELRSPRTYRWHPLAADAIAYLRRSDDEPPTSEEAKQAVATLLMEEPNSMDECRTIAYLIERQSRRIAELESRVAAEARCSLAKVTEQAEHLAELQRALEEAKHWKGDFMEACRQREAAEKDAARYRWLRDSDEADVCVDERDEDGNGTGVYYSFRGAALDAEIDAALATAQPSEGSGNG